MKAIRNAGVFLSCLGLCALVAWVGGYNFDRRDFWAAYGLVVSIFASGVATALAAAFFKHQTNG